MRKIGLLCSFLALLAVISALGESDLSVKKASYSHKVRKGSVRAFRKSRVLLKFTKFLKQLSFEHLTTYEAQKELWQNRAILMFHE